MNRILTRSGFVVALFSMTLFVNAALSAADHREIVMGHGHGSNRIGK